MKNLYPFITLFSISANGTASSDESDVSFDDDIGGTSRRHTAAATGRARGGHHHDSSQKSHRSRSDLFSDGSKVHSDEESDDDDDLNGSLWERHLKEGIPLQGSNCGKLSLPYKWFLQDHVEDGGKVKKVHLEIQLLSGTSSGSYSVSIGGEKRNKLIIIDQKGPSKKIFWRADRLANDPMFSQQNVETVKGFERLYSSLTNNDTVSLEQVMEIKFDFSLRKIETPHHPYDEEFYPDDVAAASEDPSIVTGINLTILVDWDDVSRPQTGEMKRNRAPRVSFNCHKGRAMPVYNDCKRHSSCSSRQPSCENTLHDIQDTPKASRGTRVYANNDFCCNPTYVSSYRESEQSIQSSNECDEDSFSPSSVDDDSSSIHENCSSAYVDQFSIADDSSTIATKSYHFDLLSRKSRDNITKSRTSAKSNQSTAFCSAVDTTCKTADSSFVQIQHEDETVDTNLLQRDLYHLDLNHQHSTVLPPNNHKMNPLPCTADSSSFLVPSRVQPALPTVEAAATTRKPHSSSSSSFAQKSKAASFSAATNSDDCRKRSSNHLRKNKSGELLQIDANSSTLHPTGCRDKSVEKNSTLSKSSSYKSKKSSKSTKSSNPDFVPPSSISVQGTICSVAREEQEDECVSHHPSQPRSRTAKKKKLSPLVVMCPMAEQKP
jgi:hypothetical protein